LSYNNTERGWILAYYDANQITSFGLSRLKPVVIPDQYIPAFFEKIATHLLRM
jgi:hypothetical protein